MKLGVNDLIKLYCMWLLILIIQSSNLSLVWYKAISMEAPCKNWTLMVC